MVWLTWRQHRMQVLVTAILLAAVGVLLVTDEVGGRVTEVVVNGLPAVPALIGMFWGVPMLAKEFESGTQRLAWTQSVSRRRWVLVKLAGLGVAVTLAGLALGAMVGAWVGGSLAGERLNITWMFLSSGVLPAAWWLFAFMIGVASGAVLRRTLPAIAATIVVFVAVILVFVPIRAHYATPERSVQGSGPTVGLDGAKVVDDQWIDRDGRTMTWVQAATACGPSDLPGLGITDECVARRGLREVILYHPASRYWQFQWTETGLLLLGAVLLGGVTVYRVSRPRRRVAVRW